MNATKTHYTLERNDGIIEVSANIEDLSIGLNGFLEKSEWTRTPETIIIKNTVIGVY